MDTRKYWNHRGKTYIQEERLLDPFYRDQEEIFCAAVRTVKFTGYGQITRVLEVGCGFGRITRAIADGSVDMKFVGVDLSQDQVENAKKYCSGYPATFHQLDIMSFKPLPEADVIVACEVLLHIPKYVVRRVVMKLLASAPVLIHDFDPNWPKGRPVADHCFHHDYDRLYRSIGGGRLPAGEVSVVKKQLGEHGIIIATNDHLKGKCDTTKSS